MSTVTGSPDAPDTSTPANPDAALTTQDIFEQLVDYDSRSNPYPLYAMLRKNPVTRLPNGTFLVSGYQEVLDLVHDPRVSSDPRNLSEGSRTGHAPHGETETESDAAHGEATPSLTSAFVMLDPPEHDRLRSQTMRHFGPPHKPDYLDGLRADMTRAVNDLIDRFADQHEVDIVSDFAYPFPVDMICEVLGVPHEDESLFHGWSEAMIALPEATTPEDVAEKQKQAAAATREMTQYLSDLADAKRENPADDLLSGLVHDGGPHGTMSRVDMLNTAIVLLVGGHETTVNMIANGVLTLLRNPETIERVNQQPELIARVFEELLRFEPPAQVTPTRVALADLTLGGVTIPKGSSIWVMWAAANRDAQHFDDPDRFDPDRDKIDHFGFGSGIHSCFGAPLARLETQTALFELFRRLENPRLVVDPPPYRRNPFLRGPSQLRITFDGVRPR